ncbi:P-loop NTPase fold protein [Streptomyces sp. NPDC056373]|uniref:KAP family P-loop NTPase fold protein n=1 Tax=Streptomyces sp. NPDC056373 TaxID=3345798 RepID=UPI0035DE8102
MRAALPKEERWSEVRQRIGGFGQAISPLGKLTALAGLDSEGLIQSFSDRITGDTSASAAKRKAEDALRQAGQPVLVVMDDLDRLTPDELLLVFKLVRLVGHLPNVYYLISFDEQTLLDVLQRSDLVGNSEGRAREFLEKIIQVRLDLPAFRERDAAAMSIRALNTLLDSHSLSMTPGEERRFSGLLPAPARKAPDATGRQTLLRAGRRHPRLPRRKCRPGRLPDRHLPARQRAWRLPTPEAAPRRTDRQQHRPSPTAQHTTARRTSRTLAQPPARSRRGR